MYLMNPVVTTVKVKLLPSVEQRKILLQTMQQFNECCNYISKDCFYNSWYSRKKLHEQVYYDARNTFPELTSQMVIRAIGKVLDAYKTNPDELSQFNFYGAMVYDPRIATFQGLDSVKLTTTQGRLHVALDIPDNIKETLRNQKRAGEFDLLYNKSTDTFYIAFAVEHPSVEQLQVSGVLGIDVGIISIAYDSNGKKYSGAKINNLRKRYQKLRSKLQSKKTYSARKLIKKIGSREAKMCTDINHCISKEIVNTALRHSLAIALEDLTGMSKNREKKSKTANKAQRKRLGTWGFYQLRQFIEYKATKLGNPVVLVNPKYTSQTCSKCGHVSKENRKNQWKFVCKQCGFAANADYNASLVIQERGYSQLAVRDTTFLEITSPFLKTIS